MENPREQTIGSFLREFRKEAAAYLEARIELTRLATYEQTANLASATIFLAVLAAILSIIILLLSVSLSYFLGKLIGEIYLGFASVAGIYLLLLFVLYLFRNPIKERIHSATLAILLKADEKKKENNENSSR
jgi:uncharacterized membrane protein YdjX (TVP38/TMEM64 family)